VIFKIEKFYTEQTGRQALQGCGTGAKAILDVCSQR